MMNEDIKIFPEDESAATYRTDIKGWVSRQGHYYGADERSARWDGATHKKCECGCVYDKNSYCEKCSYAKQKEKFFALHEKEWDRKRPVYSVCFDRYFFSEGDLNDYLYDEIMLDDENPKNYYAQAKLIICDPVYASEIEPYDYYSGDLPEEGDVPTEIQEAFDELNTTIRQSKAVLSYVPGKYRVKCW